MSMHAAVTDRNDLLNSLENRLEEMGDLENCKGRGTSSSRDQHQANVNKAIYQSVVRPSHTATKAGVGLYQALDERGTNKEIEHVLLLPSKKKSATAVLKPAESDRVLERQKRKESKQHHRSQREQHSDDKFQTSGGQAWTVS